MLNDDEASPSISLVGFDHLVTMLIRKTDIFVIKPVIASREVIGYSDIFLYSYKLLCK